MQSPGSMASERPLPFWGRRTCWKPEHAMRTTKCPMAARLALAIQLPWRGAACPFQRPPPDPFPAYTPIVFTGIPCLHPRCVAWPFPTPYAATTLPTAQGSIHHNANPPLRSDLYNIDTCTVPDSEKRRIFRIFRLLSSRNFFLICRKCRFFRRRFVYVRIIFFQLHVKYVDFSEGFCKSWISIGVLDNHVNTT